MNVPIKSVVWLLPLALTLTACFHKTHQAPQEPLAPPVETAPLPEPSTAPENLPPPVISEPQPATPAAGTAPAESTPAKPAPAHRKKPAGKSTEQAKSAGQAKDTDQAKNSDQTKSTEQASNGSPGVSAIGELSSGNASDYRRQTEESLASTERSLNAITRPLSDSEEKTAAHIRDDLKEARTALASGDVDGAHTLAAKAKVLLAELTK